MPIGIRRTGRTTLLILILQSGAVSQAAPAADPALWRPEFGSLEWLRESWQLTPPAGFESAEVGSYRWNMESSTRWRAGQARRRFAEEMPFSPPRLEHESIRWRLRSRIAFRLDDHWSLSHETLVDSDPTLDPASRTKEYRQIDASIEIPRAAVEYRNGRLTTWIGRRDACWGPGSTGSLILSPGAAPADGFGASFSGRRWRAIYRIGRVDDATDAGLQYSRSVAGHRFEFAPTDHLRLALSEAVLVAAPGSTPAWMLNPLLPWALTQQEDRSSDEGANALWALDADWSPRADWRVYGQFLLDDYMLDSVDRRTYPDQLGWLAGFTWTSATASATRWSLGCEWSRIDNWVSVHRVPRLRYQAWGSTLGHPAGPGSESLTLHATFDGRAGQFLVWSRWYRRGDIWIGTERSAIGATNLDTPAAPVSRTLQGGITWRTPARGPVRMTLRAGWTDLRTDDEPPLDPADPTRSDPDRGFRGSITLSIPLLRLRGDLGS